MFWGKIEESKKVDSHWELNSGHLVCTASALPLSYGRGEKDVLRLFNLNLFIARWGMSSKHDYNYTCIYCHLWVITFVTMCYSLNYSKIRKLAFWVLIFGVTSDLIHSQIQNLLHAFNPRLSPPTSLCPIFSDPISRGILGMTTQHLIMCTTPIIPTNSVKQCCTNTFNKTYKHCNSPVLVFAVYTPMYMVWVTFTESDISQR